MSVRILKIRKFFQRSKKNFNNYFFHNKTPKNLKTVGAFTECTDLTFRTFKKLFNSWHNPFKGGGEGVEGGWDWGRGGGRVGGRGKLKKMAGCWNEEKEVSGCRKGTYGPVKWQFRNKLVSFQKSPGWPQLGGREIQPLEAIIRYPLGRSEKHSSFKMKIGSFLGDVLPKRIFFESQ